MRAGVGRACAEVAHRILEEWLLEVSLDIFEQTIFVALAVPHFAKDFSILGYDALDCLVRAVRIVRRLHRDLIGERVYVLEGHLAVGEQLAGEVIVQDKFSLAVAYWDGELIPYVQARQPRRICCGNPSGDHLGDMSVDVVPEQGRRVLSDHSKVAVRQQAGFHQSLESIAYS